MSLANAYQHSALEDIAQCVESNADFFYRVVNINTHLQTEEHFVHDAHQRSPVALERSFHKNHDDPKHILMLGLHLQDNGEQRACPPPPLLVEFKHGRTS